jgi:hypothetical protein
MGVIGVTAGVASVAWAIGQSRGGDGGIFRDTDNGDGVSSDN